MNKIKSPLTNIMEIMNIVMKRIEKELCVDRDLAVVESASKMEGRQAVMVLSPKKR